MSFTYCRVWIKIAISRTLSANLEMPSSMSQSISICTQRRFLGWRVTLLRIDSKFHVVMADMVFFFFRICTQGSASQPSTISYQDEARGRIEGSDAWRGICCRFILYFSSKCRLRALEFPRSSTESWTAAGLQSHSNHQRTEGRCQNGWLQGKHQEFPERRSFRASGERGGVEPPGEDEPKPLDSSPICPDTWSPRPLRRSDQTLFWSADQHSTLANPHM